MLSNGTDTTNDCWLVGTLWIMDDVGDVDEPIPGVSGTVVKGDEDFTADEEDNATADCEAVED